MDKSERELSVNILIERINSLAINLGDLVNGGTSDELVLPCVEGLATHCEKLVEDLRSALEQERNPVPEGAAHA